MTADWTGHPMPPRQGPYRDVESLIRATFKPLARAAFRCLGNKADAEDAAQTACIKVMRNWPVVGALATAKQQHAYLYKTMINETLQIRRRPHRRWECLGVEAMEPSSVPECLDEHNQDARKKLRLVWEAISKMPKDRREVVSLFAAGYEYREIEEMLDLSVKTVRSHVSRARQELRGVLDDEDDGEKGLE